MVSHTPISSSPHHIAQGGLRRRDTLLSSTRISSGVIASMYLGNVVGFLVLTTVPIFASILRVPFAAVVPMIIVSYGAYVIQDTILDIWLMLGFGGVGYVFKKIGFPLARFTLACWAVAQRMHSACR